MKINRVENFIDWKRLFIACCDEAQKTRDPKHVDIGKKALSIKDRLHEFTFEDICTYCDAKRISFCMENKELKIEMDYFHLYGTFDFYYEVSKK